MFLKLNADYTIKVLSDQMGNATGEVGRWTMIYDQAVQIELPDRHSKYTANLRYSIKDNVKPKDYEELKSGAYEYFDSKCNETMVGVKFDSDQKEIQCWVGYQSMPLTSEKPRQDKKFSPLILA